MQQTIAQQIADKDFSNLKFQNKEMPMYRTTKDLHYPISSFQNA